MIYKQLFDLEDYLSRNEPYVIHLELKEKTTFEKAFGKSRTPLVNDLVMQGLYIVIICDDEAEYLYLYRGILANVEGIEYSSAMITDIDEDGIRKIIIGVDESK